MAKIGDVVFDVSMENHDEIWDDTELIRAYDRAQRQIETRLKTSSKNKKKKVHDERLEEKVTQTPTKLTMNQGLPVPLPLTRMKPPKDETDAMNSMLMAWYMAGYHAGRLAAKNCQK